MPLAEWRRLTLSNFTGGDQDSVSLIANVKEFLARFGYIPRIFGPPGELDEKTRRAINQYQKFYSLPTTDYLSEEFLAHIARPRCARSDFLLLKGEEDDGSPPLCFAPSQRKWLRCEVRYKLNDPPTGFSRDSVLEVFEIAFNLWVTAANLGFSFVEAEEGEPYEIFIDWVDPQSAVNVNFSVLGCFGYGEPPPENGGLKSGAFSRILFPSDQEWSIMGEPKKFHILTVALHEIGHILGLEHCGGNAVMNPNILDYIGILDPNAGELSLLKDLYRGVVCQQ